MIVETGEGIENADSYVSLGYADDYFSARGVSSWAELDEEAKEQALVRATDYVDNMFQWLGQKLTAAQSLRFPRKNLVDYEGAEVSGIPAALKQSVCDAAVLAADGTELFQTAEANGAVVSERIGELSFTYQGKSSEGVASTTLYDSINTRLRGLFRDTSRARVVSGKVERV